MRGEQLFYIDVTIDLYILHKDFDVQDGVEELNSVRFQ